LLLKRPYRKDPKRGLVFFHVIGIGYMLLGLNTVCDVYFTGALEAYCEARRIREKTLTLDTPGGAAALLTSRK